MIVSILQSSRFKGSTVLLIFIFGIIGCSKSANDVGEEIYENVNVKVDYNGKSYQAPINAKVNGFLFGITNDSPPDKYILNLNPPGFRFNLYGENNIYPRIKDRDVHKQLVLSDMYGYPPWKYRPRPGTGSDFSQWESKVEEIVKQNVRNGWKGINIEYDIWNEGDFPRFWDGTFTDLFETWVRGAKIIRKYDSEALLVGPSFAYYNTELINEFLVYTKEAEVLPDIVSWHENHEYPERIEGNVEEFIANDSFDIGRIHINEYGFLNQVFIPGRLLHFIAALERSPIELAIRGCWGHGWYDNTLAGLLTPDLHPTSSWWVHKSYAELASEGNTMLELKSDNTVCDGLASYTSNGISYLMLGNNSGNNIDVRVSIQNKNSGISSCKSYIIENTGEERKDELKETEISLDTSTIAIVIPSNSVVFIKYK